MSKKKRPAPGRIELQAPTDFIARLDRAAAAVHLSRSAYVRMALERQLRADREAERRTLNTGEHG